MTERKVYYHHPLSGLIVGLVGIPFFAFGTFGLSVVGLESWWFFGGFAAVGGYAIALGIQTAFEHLVVDDQGITSSDWFGMVIWHAPWEAIESWLVTPSDVTYEIEKEVWKRLYPGVTFHRDYLGHDGTFRGKATILRVRGWYWPWIIDDNNEWRPSLDSFIQEVRARVGAKEVAGPELQKLTAG